jgi:integrase
MASVRKRAWKTKDGVKSAWQATYSDQYGKKATKTFDLKKEAHDWLAKTQVDVKAGLHTRDYGSITVRELAERWLEKAKTDGRRAGTLYLYRCRVENYITGRRDIPGRSDVEPSLIANIKLSRLGKSHVHDFVDELLRKTTKHSAYQVWRNLKEMLWYAYDRGWVERNVAIRVKFGKPEQRQLEIGRDIPTEPEVLQLLDYADEWHGFFTLAAFAGLRAGEIRALRRSDVNLRQPHPEINVRRNVDFWHTETRPKSDAGQRKVPVFPPVFEVLSKLMDRGNVVPLLPGIAPLHDDELLFPNPATGVDWHATHIPRAFKAAQKRAAIVDAKSNPKYRGKEHVLRHFFASWLIKHGVDAKQVQVLLGHASVQMTLNYYGHLFPDHFGAIHEKMAKATTELFSTKSDNIVDMNSLT